MGADGTPPVTGSQSLKAKSGIPTLAPLIPPSIRGAMREGLLTPKRTLIETAEDIRARYRDGEFAVEVDNGDFGHLHHWSLADWRVMAQKVKAKIPVAEWNAVHAPVKAPAVVAKPVAAAVMETKRITRKMAARIAEAEARKAQILAEQATLEQIKAAETPKEEEADALARLEMLRRELKSKISVAEEADILLALVRGDNAGVSRAALLQVQEILGVKAANVPETPGMASIFQFPEGVTGPAIR